MPSADVQEVVVQGEDAAKAEEHDVKTKYEQNTVMEKERDEERPMFE